MAVPSGAPSNRLPWIALAVGLLIIIGAVGVFLLNRRGSEVAVNTPSPIAALASPSPSPPPTLAAPSPPTSAAIASPPPSPTTVQSPIPTEAPSPSPVPTVAPTPVEVAPASPVAAETPSPIPASPAPAAPPSPTAFSGQVANAGGLGNTRADLDAAYGAPAGQTPDGLVGYRKGAYEYHVLLVPDINGRAALIVQLQQQTTAPPMTLDQAQAQARNLLPKDAQPPNPQPEGNPEFAVQRFTSATLAEALPATVFQRFGGQPGQLLAVYALDSSGGVTRIVVGAGNDPNALLNGGR
ncbi:MAG: hypothetical protein JOZ81_06370 [Chloroflexi bacterium]|nr:hypothetical protein [Chloroflexota bacterium]MBV9544488.1 hypothetical protein [Chloroflexota bacterium]